MKIQKTIIALLALALHISQSFAQHNHPMKGDSTKTNGIPNSRPNHEHQMMTDMGESMKMDSASMMMMNSQLSRNLPMSRDGSGTSWQPDTTPVYGYMIQGKKWTTMIHGNIFARYTNQDVFNAGGRGGHHFDAPDWLMGMTQTKVGSSGLFSANVMLSMDPFLVGADGYPLLFQTGESYKGVKLVDRQHPHDLFSELSVAYTQTLSKSSDLYASFGYPGEPALGPPVFMHRLSAMDNPDAPLEHHYADATHITFGVATLGFRYENIKIEGSVFTGREPDENRYNFDAMRFDSYSLRLSYNPSKEWALQVSHGWIHSPELLEPQENVKLFTASAMYTKITGTDSYIASTLVYGQNTYSDNGKTLPSVLLESTWQMHKTAIYGSYDFVIKDASELDLLNAYPLNPDFNINALTLGANQILTTVKSTDLRLGVQATLNVAPGPLKTLYGSTPVGFEVYLRINPSLLKMKSHNDQHHMMDMEM